MDFFTADLHLGHKNIIEYDKRPFAVEEHDGELIRRWNEVVDAHDTVYVLGDLIFGSRHRAEELFGSLHGRIILIRGNHDDAIVKSQLCQRLVRLEDLYLYRHGTHAGDKIRIVLCHYPLASWERSHHGSWHLHGHEHGGLPDEPLLRLDIGCMLHDYRPIPLPQIVRMFHERINRGCKPTRHHAPEGVLL